MRLFLFALVTVLSLTVISVASAANKTEQACYKRKGSKKELYRKRARGLLMLRLYSGTWVVVLTAVFVVAGCGSSHSDSTAAVAACVSGQYAPSSTLPALRPTLKQAITGFCSEAAREGALTSSGSMTLGEQRRLIKEHPQIMFPMCAASVTIGYDRIPLAARRYLSLDPRVLGKQVCRALVAEGQGLADETMASTGFAHLMRAHPEFSAPFLFAGLMAAYDKHEFPGIPRAEFIKAARLASYDAVSEGIVTGIGGLSPSDYRIDQGRFQVLFARELKRVSQG